MSLHHGKTFKDDIACNPIPRLWGAAPTCARQRDDTLRSCPRGADWVRNGTTCSAYLSNFLGGFEAPFRRDSGRSSPACGTSRTSLCSRRPRSRGSASARCSCGLSEPAWRGRPCSRSSHDRRGTRCRGRPRRSSSRQKTFRGRVSNCLRGNSASERESSPRRGIPRPSCRRRSMHWGTFRRWTARATTARRGRPRRPERFGDRL